MEEDAAAEPGAAAPEAGLLLAVVPIAVFGALMHFFLFERLIGLGTGLLNRIPVVKSLYSALQDFLDYVGHRSTDDLSRVVLVTLQDDCRLIGFVTNPRFELEDGQEVAMVERETPTRGKELSLLQQLFGNLGRFNDVSPSSN